MSEYIKREDVLKSRISVLEHIHGIAHTMFVVTVQDINDVPAADVEPVVHEPCEFCGGGKTEYSDSAYGKFFILKDGYAGWCIAAEFSKCPPFADCAVKNMKLTHLRQIKHCPNCGRKLDMDERSGSGE